MRDRVVIELINNKDEVVKLCSNSYAKFPRYYLSNSIIDRSRNIIDIEFNITDNDIDKVSELIDNADSFCYIRINQYKFKIIEYNSHDSHPDAVRLYTELYGWQLDSVKGLKTVKLSFTVEVDNNDRQFKVKTNEFPHMRYIIDNNELYLEISTTLDRAVDFYSSNSIPILDNIFLDGKIVYKSMFNTTNTLSSDMVTITYHIIHVNLDLDLVSDTSLYIYKNNNSLYDHEFIHRILNRFLLNTNNIEINYIKKVKEQFYQRCIDYCNKSEWVKKNKIINSIHLAHLHKNKETEYKYDESNKDTGYYLTIVLSSYNILNRRTDILAGILIRDKVYKNHLHTQLVKIDDLDIKEYDKLSYQKKLRGYYKYE